VEAVAKSHQPRILSGWLEDVLDPDGLTAAIRLTAGLIKKMEAGPSIYGDQVPKIDAIAFRGMSGALVAPAVASLLGRQLIMVRKPELSTHSTRRVEGDVTARYYVVVDDFVYSGETLGTIISDIAEWQRSKDQNPATCVGIIPYLRMSDKVWFEEYDQDGRGYVLRRFGNIRIFHHLQFPE
jgi:hypothetical protein